MAKKPAKEKPVSTVRIQNVMAAGKLFSSLGILAPGECAELPADEARHFVDSKKAVVTFPETVDATSGDAEPGADSENDST